MRGRARGFTLVEILVATVILAVMGVMAYRSVSEARVAAEHANVHMDRLREVQRAMNLLVTDFRTLAPRPVRERIGDGYLASLLRDPNAVSLVELSHAGWPNGAGTPRGTVQRVAYRLAEQTITVAAGCRIKARVELRQSNPHFPGSHIAGQVGVQRIEQIALSVLPVQVKRSNLTAGMNACIRPPGK